MENHYWDGNTFRTRWTVESFPDVEHAINVLHRRSIRDKTDIDILMAQVDLLTTPFWRIQTRRRCKKWIAVLVKEKAEEN